MSGFNLQTGQQKPQVVVLKPRKNETDEETNQSGREFKSERRAKCRADENVGQWKLITIGGILKK